MIIQNLPSGVLIDIKSQFKTSTTVFLRDFLRKKSIFLKQTHKTIRLTQKNETIVNMIAKVFNHQLFWKKWEKHQVFIYSLSKSSIRLLVVFPKICFPWEQWLCATLRKKTTEAKKEKGEPLNCFLWQVAFMQHFLTYVPHQFQFVFCFFPPLKK